MRTFADKIRDNAEAMIRANEVYGTIAQICGDDPASASVKQTMEQAMLAMVYAMKIGQLDDDEMEALSRQIDDENRARRALMEGGV